MDLQALIHHANNHIVDSLQSELLEKSYQDSFLWCDVLEKSEDTLEKARQAAPIGTIKQTGGAEYIKTAEGWRYHTSSNRTKTQEHFTQSGKSIPAHLNGDMSEYKKNSGSNVSYTVKEGSQLTAKDGTKGEVVSHNGHSVTIKYKAKDGSERTVEVDSTTLEHKVAGGGVKHSQSKEAKEQQGDPKHEDNDENIKTAAETEQKTKPKTTTAKKAPVKKGSLDELISAQGLDAKDYPDIVGAKGLSDGEKLQLIMIRNEIGGKGNKKGSITRKEDKVKKADIFTGGLSIYKANLIKSNFK